MKTAARNQCLKCGAILELPDSLEAGLCMECRQKAAPEPRQETRWQLEAQVKAAEQQLAQKNQQLLDSDNTIARLQSERALLIEALKRCVYVIGHNACTTGTTPNGFVVALNFGRRTLAILKGDQS